jgi:hypothetical protein
MAAPIAPGRKQFPGYAEKYPYNCEWNNPDPLDDLDDDGNDVSDYNLLDEQFMSLFPLVPADNSTLLAELDRHAPVGVLTLPTPENIQKARDSGVPFGSTPPTPFTSAYSVVRNPVSPPASIARVRGSLLPGAGVRAAPITPLGLTPAATSPIPLLSFNSRLARAGLPRPLANPGAPISNSSPAVVSGASGPAASGTVLLSSAWTAGGGGMMAASGGNAPSSPRPSSPASSVMSGITIGSHHDLPPPPIIPYRPPVPDPRIPKDALLVFDQFDKESVIHFYAGFWAKAWYVFRLDLLFLVGMDLRVPGASRTEDYAVHNAENISQAIRHDFFTFLSSLVVLAYGAGALHRLLEPGSVFDFYYVLALIYMLYAFSVCVIVYLGWCAIARAPSPVNGFFVREYSAPLQRCGSCKKMAPIEDLLNLHCDNGNYADLALHFVHEDCLRSDLLDQKRPFGAWQPGRYFSCPQCRYGLHAYVKPIAYPRGALEESKFFWFVYLFWARRNKYVPDSRSAKLCKTIPEENTCRTVQFAELLYRPLLAHFLNVNFVLFFARSVYLSLLQAKSWGEWIWVVPATYMIQIFFVRAVAQRLMNGVKDHDPLGFFLAIFETLKIARHPLTLSSWTNPNGIRKLVSDVWFVLYHVLLKALWSLFTATLPVLVVVLIGVVAYSFLSWKGFLPWS